MKEEEEKQRVGKVGNVNRGVTPRRRTYTVHVQKQTPAGGSHHL